MATLEQRVRRLEKLTMGILKTLATLEARVKSLENDRRASRAGYPGYD